MRQVTPDEAKSELLQLIEAALHGEQVVIAQDDDHAVQLIPMPSKRRSRRAGTAKGLFTIHPDFDAPLNDFEEYMR
jgi:antitoxin (DNA-binding transcriptional repressor) of toxin-antitoxin stability system